MSPYLTTGYKLPSSPTCFIAWELEDLSHPTRWLHVEPPEKIAEDARIVVQKVPVQFTQGQKGEFTRLFTNSAVPYFSMRQSHIA